VAVGGRGHGFSLTSRGPARAASQVHAELLVAVTAPAIFTFDAKSSASVRRINCNLVLHLDSSASLRQWACLPVTDWRKLAACGLQLRKRIDVPYTRTASLGHAPSVLQISPALVNRCIAGGESRPSGFV